MVRKKSQVSNPPFSSFDIRGVNNELLGRWVILCCGHQILDVRAMSKFRLSITSQNFTSDCRLIDGFDLFFGAKIFELIEKHEEVEGEWHLLGKEETILQFGDWVEFEDLVMSDQLPGMSHHDLLPRRMDSARVKLEDGVVGDLLLDSEKIVEAFFVFIDHVGQFLLLKGAFCSLFL